MEKGRKDLFRARSEETEGPIGLRSTSARVQMLVGPGSECWAPGDRTAQPSPAFRGNEIKYTRFLKKERERDREVTSWCQPAIIAPFLSARRLF